MDPITLAIAAGAGIISILGGLGAVAAPVAGAAAAAGPLATLGVAVGAPLAAGSVAATGLGAAGIGANPHAALGVSNAFNDALNGAKDAAAGSINGLQLPGVPPVNFN